MNVIHLIGRVGRDVEVKTFDSGGAIANFSLATSRKWRDGRTGEQREKTEWHQIKVTNDNLVKIVERYLSKGDQVAITGAVEYREFEKDGSKRYATDIVVGFMGAVHLLGNRRDGDSTGERGAPPPSDDPRTAMSGTASQTGGRPSDFDDDIPF